jgi:UTP:GlnB (protein PII) uridylyltransferase
MHNRYSKDLKLDAQKSDKYLKVRIITYYTINSFLIMVGTLLSNGASIANAELYINEDGVFAIFYITEIFGANLQKYSEKSELDIWTEGLERSLARNIDNHDGLDIRIQNMKKRMKLSLDTAKKDIKVDFNDVETNKYNLTINCSNRPVLVYDIVHYLVKNQFVIEDAIINTPDSKITGEFWISKKNVVDDGDIALHQANLIKIIEK